MIITTNNIKISKSSKDKIESYFKDLEFAPTHILLTIDQQYVDEKQFFCHAAIKIDGKYQILNFHHSLDKDGNISKTDILKTCKRLSREIDPYVSSGKKGLPATEEMIEQLFENQYTLSP